MPTPEADTKPARGAQVFSADQASGAQHGDSEQYLPDDEQCEPLRPGMWVRIKGLRSAGGLALNGLTGRLVRFDATRGRWCVDLCGEKKAVLPGNLHYDVCDELIGTMESFDHHLANLQACKDEVTSWAAFFDNRDDVEAISQAASAIEQERSGFLRLVVSEQEKNCVPYWRESFLHADSVIETLQRKGYFAQERHRQQFLKEHGQVELLTDLRGDPYPAYF